MMAAVATRSGEHRSNGAANDSLRYWTGCNPAIEVDPLQQLRVVRSPTTSRAEALGGGPKASAPDSCMKLRPSIDTVQNYPNIMGGTSWGDALDYPIRGNAEASTTTKSIAHFPPLRAPSTLDDDRFELLATKRGTCFSEDRPAVLPGPAMGDPTSSVVPPLGAGSVLEPWSCSSSNAGGVMDQGTSGALRWMRQGPQEDGRLVVGQQQLREEPESVSAPSQRLHEMKEYFLWQKRANRNGGQDLQQRHELVEDLSSRSRPDMNGDTSREEANVASGSGGSAGGSCVSDGAGGGGGAVGERGLWNDGIKSYPLPNTTMTGVLADVATIVSNQNGDDGDRSNGGGNGRVWEVEPNGSAVCDDGGEFDPQAECRPGHPGNGSGGSPTSWWRDAPETVNTSFPWDLQLPNPAPPLALPHSHSLGLRPAESTQVGLGSSPAFRTAGHAPMCRCDTCSAAGGVARRRGSEHPGSLFGVNNGRGAALNPASFSDSGAPVYGNMRWSANASSTAEACIPWGHEGAGGNGNDGGGGPGPGVDCGYDVRRGGIASDDALAPRAPPVDDPTTSLGSELPSVGFGPERFASDLHPLAVPGGYKANTVCTERAAQAGALGGGGGPRVKRSRMNSGGAAVFHNELEPADEISMANKHPSKRPAPSSTRGTRQPIESSEKVRNRDTSKASNGKKAPASSRRCRADGCQSHPNFGVEGDRRALYCAKHKLAGMINVKAPRCQDPSCTRNPVYGHPGDPRATFCLKHKSTDMVDVKNRCCQHAGCKHQPSFGMAGDRRANFCFAHKLPSHVNIRRAKKRMG